MGDGIMARAYIDGEFVELTAEQIAELQAIQAQDTGLHTEADAQPDTDRIQQLAAGLSTAKTIAEIRSAAKQILDETNGGDTDE